MNKGKTNLNRPLLVKIGLSSINNDPLDFHNNTAKIIKSIQIAKEKGCRIRTGGELELPGYTCNEHFNQYDTVSHSWDMIFTILESKVTEDILCHIGMPVIHNGGLYNTLVILLDNKVIGIRPKICLADNGTYNQSKWFANWKVRKQITDFKLPKNIQEITGQKTCPIGEFIIQLNDTKIGHEVCAESWISKNPMIELSLDGAEIIINASASCSFRDKLKRKIQMVKQFTERHGGCYCYVNIKGGIGERTYFDGECIFSQNGRIKSISELHRLEDVFITEALADLKKIRTFRLSNKYFGKSSLGVNRIPYITIDFDAAVCCEKYLAESPQAHQRIQKLLLDYHCPHATWQPALFLWDYLRKSNANGYFLALSGGMDSCSVAMIIYNMCELIYGEIKERANQNVLEQLRTIVKNDKFVPNSPAEICQHIFFTAYMATSNSSSQTRERAEKIAKTIGANHRYFNFDDIYKSCQQLGEKSLGTQMNFLKNGGTWAQDIALQNIQARSRMMLTYMFSQMQLESINKKGFLLVLGSANLCQSLRGYFTKYDCSSADINPIGSFSKVRLRQFLEWNYSRVKFDFIQDILKAPPTAQLRPLSDGEVEQTDEQDMGFTYEELEKFGNLRQVSKLGPVSIFEQLYQYEVYKDVRVIAEKVKKFFRFYSQNRHKMAVATPSFHYNPQGCDDNRYDMRPLIYKTDWKYQFEVIDKRVEEILEQSEQIEKK